MLIKELNKLNDKIIKDIRELESVCKKHDGLNGDIFLDTSLNFDSHIKSIFILYDENKLISLISMFVPMHNEAEISAFTLPEYRNKGYFKELLLRALKELKKYKVSDIIFVCESQSKDGIEVVKKLGAAYDFTEYCLHYKKAHCLAKNEKQYMIKLRSAKIQDAENLISLNQEIFNDSYEDCSSMVTKTFQSENRKQFLAFLNEECIGICCISIDDAEISIFGLGIVPKYQGKGYGKGMLELLLKYLQEKRIENITIEVNSDNERAFNLYRKCGFEVQTAFEYYRKSILD